MNEEPQLAQVLTIVGALLVVAIASEIEGRL